MKSGSVIGRPMSRTSPISHPGEDFSVMVTLLTEIRDELRLLRETRTTRTVTRSDREVLERLLPAIVGVFGGASFATRELIADPAIHAVLGGRNAKKAGNLLSRLCGHPSTDGLELSRCETSEHGSAVWVVSKPLSPKRSVQQSEAVRQRQ
jgi:hypothetical protein